MTMENAQSQGARPVVDAKQEVETAQARKGLMKWLWRNYLSKLAPLLIIASIFMMIEGSMMGLLSYMMKPMFDQIFIEGDTAAIYWVGSVIFGIFMLRAVSSVAQKTLLSRVGAKVVIAVQSDALGHLMRLDTQFHQRNPPGSLIERLNGDAGIAGNISAVILSGFGRDGIALVSLLAVVISIDWRWTIAAMIGVPLLVLPTVLAQAYVRRTSHRSRILAGRMTTRLDEIFHGIVPIKLNALERYQSNRFEALADARVSASTRAALGQALIPGLVDVMTGIGFFAVLVYGGSEIIAGTKTVGEFMAFFTAMALAFEPLRRVGSLWGHWQQATVSLGRLQDLFETQPSLTRPETPALIPSAVGDLTFRDVSLNYGDSPVLQGVSFTAKAGQTTALVGASGAGKTTIFNVLTRLAEYDAGSVLMGGTEITDLDPDALRSQFSMVTQDPSLFDETLRDNVLLGREDVSPEALNAALEAAQVNRFVPKLPNGLDTPVGPRGSALSGGQRQRVAIARALLRDSPILLLDEATSALDAESEVAVQRAIDALAKGRTSLVIAHRLATVRNADKIVVMDAGRVVEEGTHETLVDAGGAYAHLYALQFSSGKAL